MDYSYKPQSGKCDVCNVEDAKTWFGDTNRATCSNRKCKDIMSKEYKEFCEKIEDE